MTKQAWGVIGAGYGDEGKGLTVDALAHSLGRGTVVVRTNGGAQAGHTVTTPGGARHVFHHVCSGALAGARSHLSRFFVSHPISLVEEIDALRGLGACIGISADPRGYVTTPWDMMVNQAIEQIRGDGRHGSCGYGFGETVGRNEETGHGLNVGDLAGPGLRAKLEAIRDEWLPARLAKLGVLDAATEMRSLFSSDVVVERFLKDCAAYLAHVEVRDDADLGEATHIVFEAAQGLMLDMDNGAFPFVTRSRTGIANMLEVAAEAGIDRIDAVYATRCYLTRHGRGPMSNEQDVSECFRVVDATNVPNPWQESLRFGLLDLDVLARAVALDIAYSEDSKVELVAHVMTSCLDQAEEGDVHFIDDGVRRCRADAFAGIVRDRLGARTGSSSYGPTRMHVDLVAYA